MAADLNRVSNLGLAGIRSIFIFENYDLIDQIKPQGMSRAEFSRSVLREFARRGNVMDYYERRLDLKDDPVTVIRPQAAPRELQRAVTGSSTFITARDAAIGILRNPNLGAIAIQPDVAAQTGLRLNPQAPLPGIGMQTDTSAYDLGYSMGAAPQNRADGSSPLTLTFNQGPEQIAYGYCVVTNDIYAQRGRTIDQREAFAAGFLQARHDASGGFDPGKERIGALGTVCPTSTPAADNNTRLMLSLRSWTDVNVTATIVTD